MKLLGYYCEVYFEKAQKKLFQRLHIFLALKDKINTFATECSGKCPTYYY